LVIVKLTGTLFKPVKELSLVFLNEESSALTVNAKIRVAHTRVGYVI